MTYRVTPLNANFVQALNLIDVEFIADNDNERAVRDAWKELLDHFNSYNEATNPLKKAESLRLFCYPPLAKALATSLTRCI